MGVSVRPTVLICANTTWYVFNFRGRLIQHLIEQGFAVVVASPRDSYVDRVVALGARYHGLAMDNGGTNPVRDALLVARMWMVLREYRPAVLLTYTPKPNIYGALAARLLGVPVVTNVSGLGRAFVADTWLTRLVKALYRYALRTPAKVFFQNEDDRALFVREGMVDPKRAERLPGSGVDTARFSPVPRGADRREVVFLLVARLLWDKGVGEYVEAARILLGEGLPVRFRVLGFVDVDNPSAIPRETLGGWHREGVIEFLGATDEVVPHYSDADCVVLPSYYREGVPRSLLEAASMEIPVIAADSVGCRDAVDHEATGFLCLPRSVDDLASAMRRVVLSGSEGRAKLGRAGREKMLNEFDETTVIRRYADEIRRLVRQ